MAGKIDEQILQDVNKFIQTKKQYQDVKASVDDQIVLLEGTVKVYIEKMNLEKKVKKIKNVDGVRNHVQEVWPAILSLDHQIPDSSAYVDHSF